MTFLSDHAKSRTGKVNLTTEARASSEDDDEPAEEHEEPANGVDLIRFEENMQHDILAMLRRVAISDQ